MKGVAAAPAREPAAKDAEDPRAAKRFTDVLESISPPPSPRNDGERAGVRGLPHQPPQRGEGWVEQVDAAAQPVVSRTDARLAHASEAAPHPDPLPASRREREGGGKEVAALISSHAALLQQHGAALALAAPNAPVAAAPHRGERRTEAAAPEATRASRRGAPEPEAATRRADQSPKAAEPVPAPVVPAPAAPVEAAEGAPAALPPPPIGPEHTLLQLALLDTSLQVDVKREVVQVALHTEAAGALELEVRLHDGQANVRFDGPAAPLVAHRADELRAVLSQQGLSLGNFTAGQERGQPAERPDEPATPAPAATAARVNDPSAPRRHEGRIDVQA